MRLVAVGLLPLVPLASLAVAGCGAKYRPTGPVMGEYERALENPVQKRHEMFYSGRKPATSAPVLPVLAFGAAFDIDIAVMAKDDEPFDMVEFARMNVPWGEGYVWMALETEPETGNQTIVADLDQLTTFMPEIPLARKITKMTVADRNTASSIDVELSYDGTAGPVQAIITGDAPLKEARKRNGRTFTHSQNQLMAVLDIPAAENLFKADVSVDGRNLGVRKIGVIVPGQFALNQVQGGFATGSYRLIPTGPAVGDAKLGEVLYHPPGAGEEAITKSPATLRAQKTLALGLAAIQTCWAARVAEPVTPERPAATAGALAFSWGVTNGVVGNVQPKPIEGSTWADEPLAKCVTDAVGAWRFDEDINALMSWQFDFAPGDVEAGVDPVARGDFAAIGFEEVPAPMENRVERPEPGGEPAPGPDGAPAPATPDGAMPAPGANPDEALPDGGGAAPEGGTQVVRPEPEQLPLDLVSFTSVHTMTDGSTVELPWLVSRSGDRVTASQTSELRTLRYHYRVASGTYLELVGITVEQYGRATPVTSVTFNPALPDFRWSFQGKQESNFVIDVNGQRSFATGTVSASWTDTGPKLVVTPKEPEWVAARPLVTQVIYLDDGTTEIRTQRVGD